MLPRNRTTLNFHVITQLDSSWAKRAEEIQENR